MKSLLISALVLVGCQTPEPQEDTELSSLRLQISDLQVGLDELRDKVGGVEDICHIAREDAREALLNKKPIPPKKKKGKK